MPVDSGDAVRLVRFGHKYNVQFMFDGGHKRLLEIVRSTQGTGIKYAKFTSTDKELQYVVQIAATAEEYELNRLIVEDCITWLLENFHLYSMYHSELCKLGTRGMLTMIRRKMGYM